MNKALLALGVAGGIGIASLLMQSDAGKSQEGESNAIADDKSPQSPYIEYQVEIITDIEIKRNDFELSS